MFASDLDPATKAELTRGAHLMELLKQPQFHPVAMEKQVVSIWAGTHGKLDDLDIEDVLPFESQLHDYLEHNTDILDIIRETSNFTSDTEKALDEAIEDFRKTFIMHDGKPLVVPTGVNAEEPESIQQEKLVVGKGMKKERK